MPRLFVGLDLPQNLRDDLALMQGGLIGARWVESQNYHLTLRFIGDVERALAREIATFLADVAAKSFQVKLTGFDALGGEKPHALVLLARPDPPLVELHQSLERLMRRLGVPAHSRRFVPHVTLASLRQVSARKLADHIAARGFFAHRHFDASHFVLFSSRDKVGGGLYGREACYPLK